MASDWQTTKKDEEAKKKRVKELIKEHAKDEPNITKCPFTCDDCIRLCWCFGGYCCIGMIVVTIFIAISFAYTGKWVSPSIQCDREFVMTPLYIQLPSIVITALLTWIIANARGEQKKPEIGSYDIELQIQQNQQLKTPSTPNTPNRPHGKQSTGTDIFGDDDDTEKMDKIPGSEYENKRTKYKKRCIKYCKNYVMMLTVYKIIVFLANIVVDIMFMIWNPTYFCYSMIVVVSGNYKQYLCVLLITLYKLQLYNRGEFKMKYMSWRTRIWYGVVHLFGLIYLPALIVNGCTGILFLMPSGYCCRICCNICFRKVKWKWWSFIRFMILFVGAVVFLMYFTENIPISIMGADENIINRNIKDWWNAEGVTDYWELIIIWMFAQLT